MPRARTNWAVEDNEGHAEGPRSLAQGALYVRKRLLTAAMGAGLAAGVRWQGLAHRRVSACTRGETAARRVRWRRRRRGG